MDKKELLSKEDRNKARIIDSYKKTYFDYTKEGKTETGKPVANKDNKKIAGWLDLKNKTGKYTKDDVVSAIYDAAKQIRIEDFNEKVRKGENDGKKNPPTTPTIKDMHELVLKLTYKYKTHGRSQGGEDRRSFGELTIIRDENGKLRLVNPRVYQSEVLKGQKDSGNKPKTSLGQTTDLYKQSTEKTFDAGEFLRLFYPDAGNDTLEHMLSVMKVYAKNHKISFKSIIILLGLKKIRYAKHYDDTLHLLNMKLIDQNKLPFNEKDLKFIPVVENSEQILIKKKLISGSVNERKKHGNVIVISEIMSNLLKEELEMTEYKFFSNVKSFLSKLLSDPVNAQPSETLKTYGYNRSKLINKLLSNNIIEKKEKISDKDENGEPKTATMKVRYKVPKKDFDRKLKKLYIKLFEKNLPKKVNEDGEGATSADASGQFSQPVFGVQRRKIHNIDETDTNSVGDYEYDVPFAGDDETLARKNGKFGSVSINKA